jgi:DNA-binding transcriptional LysR family regulator
MGNEKESHNFQGLTIQQIEIFLTVAKHLNYSLAAKELYLSQPAISSRIMSMEAALGLKLFIRKNRGVELTPDGTELYTKLEHVYQRFRVSVNMIIRDIMKVPKLNVGCLNSTDIITLTEGLIERFRSADSNVNIDYEMYNYNDLRAKLICGDLDIIVTMHFDVINQGNISSRIIGSMPYYFVFPKDWARQTEDVGTILKDKALILEIHNGDQHALDICRRYGFKPLCIRHVDSYLKISKIVAEGDCFTIGSRDIAKESHFLPLLSFVPITAYEEPIAVAWLDNKPLPQELLELL